MPEDILDIFPFLTEEQKQHMRSKARFPEVAEKLEKKFSGLKQKKQWKERFNKSPEKDYAVEKERGGDV